MEKGIVPIIIPSLEPDDRLTQLVRALAEAQLGPIVLVDDGSSEAYRGRFEECCAQYGCILLRHAVNLGKGRALKTAFEYILQPLPEHMARPCGLRNGRFGRTAHAPLH